MGGGGSKSAKGGPNPLADMDRGGSNPLADLDRGVQIRGGSKSAVTPAAGVFAGYLCIKRRLLLLDKSKEKLCFNFCKISSHVA